MKKDVINKVARVLTEYPHARDDDNFLIAILYRNYYGVGSGTFFDTMINMNLYDLPSPESITRYRRKLQQDYPLLYGASGQVRKERAKEERIYHKHYGRA